jgi:hypothetical protein
MLAATSKRSTIEYSYLAQLQCPEQDLDFDQLPTLEELNKAISDMALLTAPGGGPLSNGNAKMPTEASMALLSIIHHYWNGLDKNPEWNEALLCITIYKKKGKHDNLVNNYRGICLQDLITRHI